MILTRAQREAIVAEFAAGEDPEATATRFGIRRQHVYRLASARGVHRVRRKVPIEDYSTVVERYQAGNSMQQIASGYACSTTTIAKIVKAAGVTRPRGGRLRPLTKEQCEQIV